MSRALWSLINIVLLQIIHITLGQTETVLSGVTPSSAVSSEDNKTLVSDGNSLAPSNLLAFKTGTFLDNTETRVKLTLILQSVVLFDFLGNSWWSGGILGRSVLHGQHLPDHGPGQEMYS